MKKLTTVLLILFVTVNLNYAQTDLENLNLPPGAHLSSKAKIFDLSEKLTLGYSTLNYVDSDLRFLKPMSEAELQEMEGTPYYDYIMEGRNFIENLSPKIKELYSEAELWYIYAFDRKLSERIAKIQ